MLSAEELILHIRGCSLNDRNSQKAIFSNYYGYAMAICTRYTDRQEDATEIINDGFLKVFKEAHRFTPAYTDVVNSFKGWLRSIMVYTAIDHNRKFYKYDAETSFSDNINDATYPEEDALDKLAYTEILKTIKKLTPAYRMVLNLYIIDGFTHQEIAEQLEISVGTSKSNLSKAKAQLRKLLFNSCQTVYSKNET